MQKRRSQQQREAPRPNHLVHAISLDRDATDRLATWLTLKTPSGTFQACLSRDAVEDLFCMLDTVIGGWNCDCVDCTAERMAEEEAEAAAATAAVRERMHCKSPLITEHNSEVYYTAELQQHFQGARLNGTVRVRRAQGRRLLGLRTRTIKARPPASRKRRRAGRRAVPLRGTAPSPTARFGENLHQTRACIGEQQ